MIKLQKKRHFLLSTLIAGGMLLVSPQAEAAHWELSFRPDGQRTTTGSYWNIDSPWLNTDHPEYDANTGWIGQPSGPVYFSAFAESEAEVSGNTTVASSASAKGSVAVRVKWVQDTWDVIPVPAPKYAFLKIWGSAAGAAWAPASTQANARFGNLTEQEEGQYNEFMGTYDALASREINENTPLLIPISLNGNSAEATYVFPISAEGSTASYSPGTWGSYSVADIRFNAELKNVGVAISSNIETSWKKWAGAVEDLPNAYKARNSSGQFINEPNEKAVQVAGQSTTNDSTDDIWKLACLRNADGTMDVHSAAIERILDGGTIYGGGIFTANVTGISYPSYKWTLNPSGGSPSTLASDELDKDEATIDLSPTAQLGGIGTTDITYGGIDLGRQSDGTFLFKSSTLEVEAGNPAEILRVKDTYTVNWHLPRENWQNYGPATPTYDYPTVDVASPGYAISGGGVNVSYISNGDYWGDAISTAINNMAVVGASALPAPFSSLSAAASLIHLAPQPITTPVDFNAQWAASTSTFIPNKDNSLKNRYRMVPELRVGYTIKFWEADSYDANGYAGPDRKATAKRNGEEEWIATFSLQSDESSEH